MNTNGVLLRSQAASLDGTESITTGSLHGPRVRRFHQPRNSSGTARATSRELGMWMRLWWARSLFGRRDLSSSSARDHWWSCSHNSKVAAIGRRAAKRSSADETWIRQKRQRLKPTEPSLPDQMCEKNWTLPAGPQPDRERTVRSWAAGAR